MHSWSKQHESLQNFILSSISKNNLWMQAEKKSPLGQQGCNGWQPETPFFIEISYIFHHRKALNTSVGHDFNELLKNLTVTWEWHISDISFPEQVTFRLLYRHKFIQSNQAHSRGRKRLQGSEFLYQRRHAATKCATPERNHYFLPAKYACGLLCILLPQDNLHKVLMY